VSRVYSDKNIIEFPDGFSFQHQDVYVSGNSMRYDLNTEYIEMSKQLKITKKESASTNGKFVDKFNLSCEYLTYNTRQRDTFHFQEKINIWRGNESIKGDVAEYNDTLQKLSVNDNVLMTFHSSNPWGAHQSSIDDELHQMSASHVDIYFKQQEMMLTGPLYYEQPDTKIEADQGWFDMEKNMLYLSGHVRINKNSQVLRADNVEINVKQKTFEARGAISTQISI